MATKPHGWIRIIYLYLFAVVGLFILVFGTIGLIDLGLRTYIFKKADISPRIAPRPIFPEGEQGDILTADSFVEAMEKCAERCPLTDEEREALRAWLSDYERFQQSEKAFPEEEQTSQRQRDAARNISMVLVGFPLFFFHWQLIQADIRKGWGASPEDG